MLDEIKKKYSNAWQRWDSLEDELLFSQWAHHNLKILSQSHNRTIGAISARLKKLGLAPQHYTETQIENLIEKLKNFDPKIKELLVKRGIISLFHFTHIDNLSSIFLHGLLGPKALTEINVSFKGTDPIRLDAVENGISISVSEPNRFMLSKKIYAEKFGSDLVILEVDSSYLCTTSFLAFPSNAASSKIRQYRNLATREFNSTDALELLFNNIEVRNKFDLKKNIPTDPQSELMVLEDYPIFSIKSIHFQNSLDETEIDKIRSKLLDVMSLKSVTLEKNSKYFNDVWSDNESIQLQWNERKWSQSWE